MRLFEFEAKQLLAAYQINLPARLALFEPRAGLKEINYPAVAKVQILQGRRGRRGGVKILDSEKELRDFLTNVFDLDFDGEKAVAVMAEEEMAGDKDFYLALAYNNQGPVLTLNPKGGMEVEESSAELRSFPLDIIEPDLAKERVKISSLLKLEDPGIIDNFFYFLNKLITCFLKEDCRFLEINPLRLTPAGEFYALDVKLELDDRANFRHQDRDFISTLHKREKELSKREEALRELNNQPEFKGSACRYTELDGNIALMLSGGGASLIIFDYLVDAGLKPGNYSEYSGNPDRKKIEALARIVLSKPDQKGLLIAGGIANFTLIDETMAGIAAALADFKPNYPIIIRRGGPNEAAGREIMLKTARENNLNITWLDSKLSLKEACDYFIKAVKS